MSPTSTHTGASVQATTEYNENIVIWWHDATVK